jgi:hypothetical protein
MGQFTDRALRVLLVIIALAILVVAARYIVFPGPHCIAGTYAGHCAPGPGDF